tara:strand:- start:14417 stop:14662 length:246 start_codon:yes stop_codon:yes gene_type:complete
MGLIAAVVGALRALTAYLTIIWPVQKTREITREIEAYEDEIFNLADSGSASDKLRLETLHIRAARARKQISLIRSANGHSD